MLQGRCHVARGYVGRVKLCKCRVCTGAYDDGGATAAMSAGNTAAAACAMGMSCRRARGDGAAARGLCQRRCGRRYVSARHDACGGGAGRCGRRRRRVRRVSAGYAVWRASNVRSNAGGACTAWVKCGCGAAAASGVARRQYARRRRQVGGDSDDVTGKSGLVSMGRGSCTMSGGSTGQRRRRQPGAGGVRRAAGCKM